LSTSSTEESPPHKTDRGQPDVATAVSVVASAAASYNFLASAASYNFLGGGIKLAVVSSVSRAALTGRAESSYNRLLAAASVVAAAVVSPSPHPSPSLQLRAFFSDYNDAFIVPLLPQALS
jgi:hypothetical protein